MDVLFQDIHRRRLFQFTGSYSYSGFRSCIAVNPWDTRNTAKAIHQALTMDDEQAKLRWEVCHLYHVSIRVKPHSLLFYRIFTTTLPHKQRRHS